MQISLVPYSSKSLQFKLMITLILDQKHLKIFQKALWINLIPTPECTIHSIFPHCKFEPFYLTNSSLDSRTMHNIWVIGRKMLALVDFESLVLYSHGLQTPSLM